MCGLVRVGSQLRESFQEIVSSSRGGLDIEELEAIILNLVLGVVSDFSSESFEWPVGLGFGGSDVLPFCSDADSFTQS